MAKPNYQFEKRQRDLAKRRKQEEKRQRKLAARVQPDGEGPDASAAQQPESDRPAADGGTGNDVNRGS